MSRVKLIQKEQASPEVKELYDKMEKNRATIINLYRVLAHNPSLLRSFLRLGGSLLGETKLSAKLRELAILRIAKLTGSEYEWAQHYSIALQAGVSHEQTKKISRWQTSTDFSKEERAILQYTDEVTQNVTVKEETFSAIQKHLNEQSIVELTLAIGYWGMVARLLVPLQVDLDAQTVGSVQELLGRKG